MPHTSHRKKQQRSKRTEILDENGWTRVSTVNPTRRTTRSSLTRNAIERRADSHSVDYSISKPYDGATVEKVEQQYRNVEKKWLTSSSWVKLEDVLRNKIDSKVLQGIDVCTVLGTGSYCGHVDGWIERFDVSLYQLAAFKAMVDIIGERVRVPSMPVY
jgi:hypothetical protein